MHVYPILSPDFAVGISEFVKNRLIQVSCFPKHRVIKIWNGIDIDRYKPQWDNFVFKEYNIPSEMKIVFSYSRANQYKGVSVLIDTAKIIIKEKKRKDIFFLFCGDGPDLEYFRGLISRYEIGEFFLCPGKTRAIDKILRGVNVVVVPSIWQEGFGLSVIEGMASGKVVIASRVGGIREIIEDSINGFLCAPGDSLEFAEKIIKVIDNDKLNNDIVFQARKTVVERFNIQNKKEELTGLFKKVCQIH